MVDDLLYLRQMKEMDNAIVKKLTAESAKARGVVRGASTTGGVGYGIPQLPSTSKLPDIGKAGMAGLMEAVNADVWEYLCDVSLYRPKLFDFVPFGAQQKRTSTMFSTRTTKRAKVRAL